MDENFSLMFFFSLFSWYFSTVLLNLLCLEKAEVDLVLLSFVLSLPLKVIEFTLGFLKYHLIGNLYTYRLFLNCMANL